eukprot:12859446-Alexandrium_andersonii.AAC.1
MSHHVDAGMCMCVVRKGRERLAASNTAWSQNLIAGGGDGGDGSVSERLHHVAPPGNTLCFRAYPAGPTESKPR